MQRLKVGESSPLIETAYGYHIIKLMERDPGGQKDLSNAQVQAQIRQAIFNQKEQMLRAVFSEVSRNNAQVKNYLAERLLETGGKSATASGTAKTEAKPEEKKDDSKAVAPVPTATEKQEEPAKK